MILLFDERSIFWTLCLSAFISTQALAQAPPVGKRPSDLVKREVSLDWGNIDDATLYEVKVTRMLEGGERKKPLFFKVKKNQWKAKINPGQYEMELRAYDYRGVPGEWSPPSKFWVKVQPPDGVFPKPKAKLRTKENDEADVTFRWKKIYGVPKYRLLVESKDGKFKEKFETSDSKYKVSLPVAKLYSWKVVALMENDEEGEIRVQPYRFLLVGKKLESPEVEKPLSKFVRLLKWNKIDYAEKYNYIIQRRLQNKAWKTIQRKKGFKGTEVEFNLANPSGFYRIKVAAAAKYRRRSKVASRMFKVKGGFRTPTAVEEAILKDSLNKPSNFYAIASYFITSIDYTGVNNERAQQGVFNALGGTGRVGLGYQNPDSNFGYFGIVDMSGFNIGSETFTFAAAEAHVTYSTYLGVNQFKFSAGAFMKELPEVIGNTSDGLESVGVLTNMGPHVGLVYWRPFNQKYGLQINARAYLAFMGSSPSGKDVESTTSFQFGVLGTYRLQENLMGFAGYAFKTHQGAYVATSFSEDSSSFAADGDINTIEISGHYLNLILEYSF